ncbi:MAG TPA: hypothetical protein VLH79_06870 [Chthonomonadales bacterium]|nr:hypothetical protein [Chthonomonadales bacterium]
MQHGTPYRGQRLRGWWMSEKLDGCRAFWDGAAMWSRGGTPIRLPAALHSALPAGIALDGEIYGGPGTLDAAREAVVHGRFSRGLRFMIFDAPSAVGAWPARLRSAASALGPAKCVGVVAAWLCEGERHAARILGEVHARGGEGLMLRAPGLAYAPGRTRDLVKLKRPYYATFLGARV